ncbi:glutamyl-tRNA(Gln) amidotransferase subunit B, mitochondrial [Oratosquilla oratoria]|uniref:glutamyl-tRNA(Gln) amidotransferase subunit B, mitochondrial n=1 Tax=Oratosquilla oratoria TaxID=337810 RepID=UPI003F76C8F7
MKLPVTCQVMRSFWSMTHRSYSLAVKTKPSVKRKVWQPVIGLEIHVQISSESKIFSRIPTKYGAPPNSQVGVFEAAHPGTLPVLNKKCVEIAVKTALALGCTVNKVSRFDRKHYFYPDLPAGYQITQLDHPIASRGHLEFHVYNSAVHKKPYRHGVDIVQIQLEEDSGKSLHDSENHRCLVDLNRAGQPLMEIVFAPGLHNGEEAAALIKELILILTRLGASNCLMEEGSLRVDANISVHQKGEPFGTRTEVKNLNSIRAVVKAIEFEIERQTEILNSGGRVVNETRSFDADKKETVSMRDKEVVQDYRFMPEPNLPPLRLYDSDEPGYKKIEGSLDIATIRASIPELPDATRERIMTIYKIPLVQAITLTSHEGLLHYFEEVMEDTSRNSTLVCNLLLIDLLALLYEKDLHINVCPITPKVFGEIVDLQQSGTIAHQNTLRLLKELFEGNECSPAEIVEANKWQTISDPDVLEELCNQILSENEKLVKKYHTNSKKKVRVMNNLMAAARVATDGRAKPALVKQIFHRKLEPSKE